MRVAVVAPAREHTSIQALVDLVTALDVEFLRRNPTVPALLASGVRYQPEPRGCDDTACSEERFCTVPIVLEQGWGDCDDLAPWRAAELIARHGIAARAVVRRVGSREGRFWHVVVERPDGFVEDPCRWLGMAEVR